MAKVLHLLPSQADWLATSAAFRLQDAGEGFHVGASKIEMLEVDKAAALATDAAEMIRELRVSRSTTHLTLARELADKTSAETIRYLGQRHMEVLRKEDGAVGRHAAERERDEEAAGALLGLEILDAIRDLRMDGDDDRLDNSASSSAQQVVAKAVEIAIERLYDHARAENGEIVEVLESIACDLAESASPITRGWQKAVA